MESAEVATIESNRPEYGNLREYYDAIRFEYSLDTVTKKVDYYPFTVQIEEPYLITFKPVVMSLEAFVLNILILEIIVTHEMQKSNCSCIVFSSNLYSTVYSENKLLHVSDVLNLYSRRPTYLQD